MSCSNRLTVYWIRHKDHSDYFTQGYIGVSNNIVRRFKEHGKSGSSSSPHLIHALSKYGKDIVYDILVSNIDEAIALDLELELRSRAGIGWNIVMGGGKPPVAYGNTYNAGRVLADTTRKKISEALKGKAVSDATKKAISNATKGVKRKPLSDAHKESIRQGNTGKKMSAEAKEKCRLANLGKKMSEVSKARMSQARSGVSLSEAHKNSISEGGRGRKLSEETKAKIGASNSSRISVFDKNTMKAIAIDVVCSEWCKEHGYDAKSITRVALGARKSHKGLVVVYTQKKSKKE